jgi:hypothetical protein
LTTSSLQTLNSGDSLDGGAGNDELFAVVNGSVTPTVLKNIEKVSFTNTAAASVIDLSNSSGITTLTSQGATNTTTMQGIDQVRLAPAVARDAPPPLACLFLFLFLFLVLFLVLLHVL